jgi:tRNA-specific 2-thiouridylase
MSDLDFDLGLAKPRTETRVVVAMSGGVDSSVTAALMAEAGYDVVGVTLQLYDARSPRAQAGTCCAGQDIYDARRVADRLGIPHYVLDYEERFKAAVIDDFADAYLRGETPIPCVRCNERVKFRNLLEVARDLGGDALATGHYVRRVVGSAGPELHCAVDRGRDQSYFLFATTAAQLAFLRFPLGDLPKERVRAEAERLGLAVAAKPDSQDICFVPNGRYAGVIERLRPGAAEPGTIVDLAGRTLGQHEGIIHFTVGQRRGLGVSASEPLYVLSLNAERREVVVGPQAALLCDTIRTGPLNWVGSDGVEEGRHGLDVTARLRSSHPGAPARLSQEPDGTAVVVLETPEAATAPGQACVLYDGDRMLGGGWITGTGRSAVLAAASGLPVAAPEAA